jgi:hypothetical protein
VLTGKWRRGRDSNPRGLAPIPVFKTGAFNRSATPPVLDGDGALPTVASQPFPVPLAPTSGAPSAVPGHQRRDVGSAPPPPRAPGIPARRRGRRCPRSGRAAPVGFAAEAVHPDAPPGRARRPRRRGWRPRGQACAHLAGRRAPARSPWRDPSAAVPPFLRRRPGDLRPPRGATRLGARALSNGVLDCDMPPRARCPDDPTPHRPRPPGSGRRRPLLRPLRNGGAVIAGWGRGDPDSPTCWSLRSSCSSRGVTSPGPGSARAPRSPRAAWPSPASPARSPRRRDEARTSTADRAARDVSPGRGPRGGP